MTASNRYYRPLSFPKARLVRLGHYLLIVMMLPMLLVMGAFGLLFGTYRRALRHAAAASEHDIVIAEIVPE